MSGRKIGIVEVFRSVQGEGGQAGRDAIFVRMAGCPLSCVFADGAVCDTPYQQANLKPTLDELFTDLIDPMAEGMAQKIDRAPLNVFDRPMLILTGGEPTSHPSFDAMVERGKEAGFFVAVETNGTSWRTGLERVHWVSCSPKEDVEQGSPAQFHNKNPQDPKLHERVIEVMGRRAGEYRYVIGGEDTPTPPYHPAYAHYLSPAVLSDGSGQEWKTGFPGFAPGAVERCLEIIADDSRWRLSIQTHKIIGVR